jgi:integrase/recombinase XerD
LASYRRDLNSFQRWASRNQIDDISDVDPKLVGAYVAGLAQGQVTGKRLSASSCARALAALRGFAKFLIEEGVLTADFTQGVVAPAPTLRLPKAVSIDSMAAMIESGETQTPVGLRDRALLEVLYGCGARVSELASLNVDDIDLITKTVVIKHAKGGKQRLVPLAGSAVSALEAYLVRGRPALVATPKAGDPALFLNTRGRRLTRQSVFNTVKTAASRAGLSETVSPHTFRHSFATHLIEGGADVRVVQELLGHASVTTTQVYTLVTIDHLREAYATAHPRAL